MTVYGRDAIPYEELEDRLTDRCDDLLKAVQARINAAGFRSHPAFPSGLVLDRVDLSRTELSLTYFIGCSMRDADLSLAEPAPTPCSPISSTAIWPGQHSTRPAGSTASSQARP